jgi:hypothetical protein
LSLCDTNENDCGFWIADFGLKKNPKFAIRNWSKLLDPGKKMKDRHPVTTLLETSGRGGTTLGLLKAVPRRGTKTGFGFGDSLCGIPFCPSFWNYRFQNEGELMFLSS